MSDLDSIPAGRSGDQYLQAGATDILLTSETDEKSNFSTSGFSSMYFFICSMFFSRSSILHGRSSASHEPPINGQVKFLRPFITDIFNFDLSGFKMYFSFV